MSAVLISHGGVGSPASYSDGCEAACRIGADVLGRGDVLEAVIGAAVFLEDEPRYNAGTGAIMRLDGSCEMDAAVMTGDGRYGAVAAITGVKNPTRVAAEVLSTPHRLLCGEGAVQFARSLGFPPYSPITQKALDRLAKARETVPEGGLEEYWRKAEFTGTVGAVARSADGAFAVSCSTGGAATMLRGRIGDSPIIGAGLYAGPLGAVCCTGAGELILDRLVAFRVYLALERGQSLEAAAQAEVDLFPEEKSLGIIAVSADEAVSVANRDMAAATRVLEG